MGCDVKKVKMAMKWHFSSLSKICGLPVLLLSAVPASGQASGAAETRLGKVNFPTSCSAEVQPTIENGVALLHSFQYEAARQTFADVEARDGKCAMAHWGKAMTLYEQLWEFPNEKNLNEGHAEIEQARKLHPKTAFEQGFLNAADVFYQKNAKLSHVERTKAYSAALEKFHTQFPDEVEAGTFYALSLVALADEDVDTMANLQKAIGVLSPLFEKYPDHPGAAHYLIHATDKPGLAPQGLAAARRYAAIAPDSPHAIHMPSHIFVRLGLWQDSIGSNIASSASAGRAAEMHKAESHYQTHAMDFLNYSYLQSGQGAKAREVIGHMDHVVGANDEVRANHRAYLAARTALELHRWKEAAGLSNAGVGKDSLDSVQWANAIGAARSGDVAEAESAVKELTKSVAEREEKARTDGYEVSTEKATDLREAEAWLAFAQGKTEQALEELRAAVAHQEKNGGESVIIPAREMLADMLTELKRPADALAEYKIVLKDAPNRFDALLGAGRAAQVAGDTTGAQVFYAKLTEVCSAGADRPELADVKTFLAQK
jgi:tetratricopeptide (TPR) repeat protein